MINIYRKEKKVDYGEVMKEKYKAKADEKMRFTKENVYRLFGDYRRGKNGINRLDNLESVIMDLDDTPEKVVVPKFVAKWYGSKLGYNIAGMTDNLRTGECIEKAVCAWLEEEYSKYGLRDRFDLLALIRINGYTIEPEQLYYIPLPHLETSDGLQQVLSKRDTYFASRPNKKLKQRFTKAELERVPEVYKPYAKPIEEESEYEL